MTPKTLVVRSDDNQYHLFTYNSNTGPKEPVQPNSRVRINGSAPDAVGTRVAEKVTVIHVLEGTVVSTAPNTLVVRSDDNQYRLFTYSSNAIPKETVKPDSRVRVNALAPGAQGTWMAESVTVIQPGTEANVSGTQAPSAGTQLPSSGTQPPASGTQASSGSGAQAGQVNQTSLKITEQARRFHIGGRVGFGLDPELFMFGPQAQFGPFFSSRLMFQPNVEFGFGELTDMYAVNGDAAFHFNQTHGWTPYVGMGPSFNFVNLSASSADVSFSNFHFQTGLNIFAGAEKHKMFVELKTNLWAGNAPVLRMYVGYNFSGLSCLIGGAST